ncbi:MULTISPECIES: chemoreceptor glutamine deamidase CheD [Ectothiorhodospira]|uniref:Probable chemoreceptor glutamine deamidase CheD n=1 Tax=Ectothiorhodospira marina TaxID=1396821 RepID=A0A1H7PKV4_9GAMM|nr:MULTISPECIES: chemoreceptor glutamine deamidase CheD [Ectothiorhodospira]MCG5516144.1 chemoreceptor glutamine deamidase CheD [Ectothiorhodospira sp. 9100]MCG5518611.1 chemoreceptor glutamine deamidase CheD [Ectothiorhodospira sp. 9905]SEL36441.1 chemotaxis protein CheD [Ectothiorhodospira marina]
MSEGFEEVLAPNLYYDRHFDMDAVKILPGEYYVSNRELLMVTVLGSCVGACVRDRLRGIGGINHFMLPDDKRNEDSRVGSSMRYGDYAMEILINQLIKLGARRENLEAKVFGAGNVLPGFKSNIVGERNAQFVTDYLATEGIPIAAQDLLGNHPRKIYFFPTTGRVLVKKLRSLHNETIIERELSYSQKLRQAKVSGEVELFD